MIEAIVNAVLTFLEKATSRKILAVAVLLLACGMFYWMVKAADRGEGLDEAGAALGRVMRAYESPEVDLADTLVEVQAEISNAPASVQQAISKGEAGK